jgi:hypothetical protein
MKEILLTQGKVTLVDDWNFDWLNQWNWFTQTTASGPYAARNLPRVAGKQTRIYMHREIIAAPTGMLVDHRDGYGLNNQEFNIRAASDTENCRNRCISSRNTSGFKGVSWHARTKKWVASIRVLGELQYLGLFSCREKAALAYDAAARKYFGEFAVLNFP